jgi:hypothetical protein
MASIPIYGGISQPTCGSCGTCIMCLPGSPPVFAPALVALVTMAAATGIN